MKKLLITSLSVSVCLFLLLLTSCENNIDYRTHIGPKQLNLLTSPKAGSSVVFDENGKRTITEVSTVFIWTTLTKDTEGGVITGPDQTSYHNESASVDYNIVSSTASKISIFAYSEDPSRPEQYPARQSVRIDSSLYTVEFSNKISSKVINGVTYTNVVLGVNSYSNDTLFWKKDIGILGWKRADQNFTAYRVF